MVMPATTEVGLESYLALGAWTIGDEATGWDLLKFMDAIMGDLQTVEDIVRDSGDRPGWAIMLDIDIVPAWAIPWLGQFVGVAVPAGLTESQQRSLVQDAAGWKRGTPAAIEAAAALYLTGTKTVDMIERNGSAYRLKVTTYLGETPDPAMVEASIRALKPAGIVLTYVNQSGPMWSQVNGGTSWGSVDPLVTWADVADMIPGDL